MYTSVDILFTQAYVGSVHIRLFQYLKLLFVASTAYHFQSLMHVKSLDTSTESINRSDPCPN